jgi:hypothetical protein
MKRKERCEPRLQKSTDDENMAPVPNNIKVIHRGDRGDPKEEKGKVKKGEIEGTMLCEVCLDDLCV